MRLVKGMKVRLSERGKDKWRDDSSNPHSLFGTVDYVYTDEEILGEQDVDWEDNSDEGYFPYHVLWNNGFGNSYRYGDLEPAIDFSNKSLEDYL